MQRTRDDVDHSERARKRYRPDEVDVRRSRAQHGLTSQHQSASERSYAVTHVDGNATAVVGDMYGNFVNNHYHAQDPASQLEKCDLLLDSLKFDRMDARLRNVRAALSNTCQWLLSHKQFRAWVDPLKIEEHHGFLWIKGKPGCGKSTVMKVALDRTVKSDSAQMILSYFFNARAPGILEKSSIGLYRSLVHQILTKIPALRDRFADTFSYKERNGVIEEWTEDELKDFLIEVAKSSEVTDITVFVDALDEGDQDDVRQMIAFLEDLGDHALSVDNRFRICLSSRHFPHITIRKGLILVMEDQEHHSQDIRSYVETKLHGNRSSEMRDLRQEVCNKSNGIFLWVVLVVAMLNKTYDEGQSLEATRKHLESIPPELDNLFADILAKTRKNLEECVTLLQFVLFSNKPFSAPDLYVAIQYGCDQSSTTEVCVPDAERLALRLLHYSRGLVEATNSKQPIMQFIHESVRDFLVTPHGLAQVLSTSPERVKGLSHEKLKEACLRCIVHADDPSIEQLTRVRKAKIQPSSGMSTLPFLPYATSQILQHANSAQRGQICQAKFLASLDAIFAKWIRLHNAFEKHEVRKYNTRKSTDVSLLYVAVEQKLVDLARCLLDEGADVNIVGGRYGNALQAACVAGPPELVQMLLDRGADPNKIGGEWKHALAAAVHHKNTEIAAILQNCKLTVPRRALVKMLHESASRDYIPGIQASVDHGISIDDHGSNQRGSPLYLASMDGNEKRVQLLLDAGADVNTQGGHHGNALQAASYEGHERVVQILLDAGAHVNAWGRFHGRPHSSALKTASKRGHVEVVQMLLSAGADVDTQEEYISEDDALQEASYRGHEKVVQILLDAGADVDAQGGPSGTALQVASRGGHEKVVQVLLDAGADVDAQGGFYGTALQAASRGGHEKVVQILLDAGADVNAQAGYVGSALKAASKEGHRNIVQILRDHGAVS